MLERSRTGVKVAITDAVEERISHRIFYTPDHPGPASARRLLDGRDAAADPEPAGGA